MKKRQILLIDMHGLCHRAFHTTGRMQYDSELTGVAFGVLRDLENLTEIFDPDITLLAFDWGCAARLAICPNYKRSRRNREMTEEEIDQRENLMIQITKLRNEYLPAMGYNNVVRVRGYEADDVIACAVEKLQSGDEAVIVSGDQDLWQCVRHNVIWRSPSGKVVTSRSFFGEWGIDPSQWAFVKAIAGCKSDDVEGVRGIGEKSAAAWFAGTLKPGSKKYESISENLHVLNYNLPLVKLPFEGFDMPDLVEDDVTEEKRIRVKNKLGIQTSRRSSKSRNREGLF